MKSLRGPLLASLLALGASGPSPGPNEVSGIRVFDHRGYTRVVVELSRDAAYSVRRIQGPPRLYVDIEGARIAPGRDREQVRDPAMPVVRVRAGQNSPRRARVVMELDREGREYRTFRLERPFRIVTDVYAGERPAEVERGESQVARRPEREWFGSRPVRRIAIDAGHGGKDPGAIGHGKLREKDVVLRVAKQLRAELSKRGFEVVMTRTGDRYLSLPQRTEVANRADADVFLSIHANAAPNRRAAGVETYLLDRSNDRQTARVAARENKMSVAELSHLENVELNKTLTELRLGKQEEYVVPFAYSVHRSLLAGLRNHYGRVQDLDVKRGPFMVLFHADMPSILVELGFLTNQAEAKRMRRSDFARNAALSIARGVERYRDDHARRLVAGR